MQYMTMTDLKIALDGVLNFLKTKDSNFLAEAQSEIKLAKELDYAIKTQTEHHEKKFVESSHGVGRMAMFYINYLGEHYWNDGTLTIFDDDPENFKAYKHINTYSVKFKDPETHENLFALNMDPESNPYDFDANFIQQWTKYSDNTKDTTVHAYESFSYKWDSFWVSPGYKKPHRRLDFKSAFWKSKHTHDIEYVLTLDFEGKAQVKYARNPKQDTNGNYI